MCFNHFAFVKVYCCFYLVCINTSFRKPLILCLKLHFFLLVPWHLLFDLHSRVMFSKLYVVSIQQRLTYYNPSLQMCQAGVGKLEETRTSEIREVCVCSSVFILFKLLHCKIRLKKKKKTHMVVKIAFRGR